MTRDFDRLTLKDRRLTSRKKVVALSCIRWMGLLVGVTQYCWVANIVYFFLTSNCLQIQFFLSQCTNSVSLYKYKYLCIVWVLFSQFCINVLLDNTDIVVSIFFSKKKKWQFIFHIEWDFSQFLLSHSTLRKREMNTLTAMVNGQNNVENVQEACFCLPAATTPSSSGENFFNGPFPPQVWLVKSSFFRNTLYYMMLTFEN